MTGLTLIAASIKPALREDCLQLAHDTDATPRIYKWDSKVVARGRVR